MDKIVGYVYETYDYDKFKLVEGNRELTKQRAKKIEKNVDEYGQIYNPAIVNEKYEIIDGGGRYFVFKNRKLPFYYTVKEGLGIKECQALNQGSKPWELQDFVNSYITENNYNYILLNSLLQKHSRMGNRTVLYAVSGRVQGGVGQYTDSIKKGNLKLDDSMYQYADELLNYAELFIANLPKEKGHKEDLLIAAMFAYTIEGLDRNRLISQYNKLGTSNDFPAFSNVKNAMDSLSAVYNKGAKKKFSIRTEWLNSNVQKYGWYSSRYFVKEIKK